MSKRELDIFEGVFVDLVPTSRHVFSPFAKGVLELYTHAK